VDSVLELFDRFAGSKEPEPDCPDDPLSQDTNMKNENIKLNRDGNAIIKTY
jgi:hypothetical protein